MCQLSQTLPNTKLTESRGLVLQSDFAPVQLHPIEKIVGKLDALLVLKDDESKVFLLFGLPVLWYGHSFQRPSVQEQLIQNLNEGIRCVKPSKNVFTSSVTFSLSPPHHKVLSCSSSGSSAWAPPSSKLTLTTQFHIFCCI